MNWEIDAHGTHLLYKGELVGVLFPSTDFPMEKIGGMVATLNRGEPAARDPLESFWFRDKDGCITA